MTKEGQSLQTLYGVMYLTRLSVLHYIHMSFDLVPIYYGKKHTHSHIHTSSCVMVAVSFSLVSHIKCNTLLKL